MACFSHCEDLIKQASRTSAKPDQSLFAIITPRHPRQHLSLKACR